MVIKALRVVLCILGMWLYGVASLAQPKERMTADTRDTGRIMKMLRRAVALQQQNPDSARAILQEGLRESTAMGFSKGIFHSLNNLGWDRHFHGDYKGALTLFFRALPHAEIPKNITASYNNIALSYSNIGKYKLALDFYAKALAVAKRDTGNNGYKDSMTSLINMGALWARLEENSRALHDWDRAMAMAERKNDTSMLLPIVHNMGAVAAKKHDWPLAGKYFRQALALATAKQQYANKVSALGGLATIANEQQQYEAALGYLAEAEAIMAAHPIPLSTTSTLKTMKGSAYLGLRRLKDAAPLLMRALAEAEETDNKTLELSLLPDVAELYMLEGKYDDAYRYLRKYTGQTDSLLKEEKNLLLEDWVNMRFADADSALLASKLQIARAEQRLRRRNFWIGGGLAGLAILGVVSFMVMRRQKHRQVLQQAELEQAKHIDEINRLKAQVRGEDKERRRVARDLHDDIAGRMWALRLNMDHLMQNGTSNANKKERLGTVQQQLSEVTRDIKKTASNLMPDLLVEGGLAAAIADLCDYTSRNTPLQVMWAKQGELPRLRHEAELSIYRMVQELLQNVLKHADGATLIHVTTGIRYPQLTITVADNGKVNQETSITEGVGLREIKRRAQDLHGALLLTREGGSGTTATLTFDVEQLLVGQTV